MLHYASYSISYFQIFSWGQRFRGNLCPQFRTQYFRICNGPPSMEEADCKLKIWKSAQYLQVNTEPSVSRNISLHVRGEITLQIADDCWQALLTVDTGHKAVTQPKSGTLVKMSLSRFGEIGGFQFSKVKLKTEILNLTEPDEDILSSQVKNVPKPPTTATNIHFDLLILAISIFSLCSVSVIICLMTISRISLPASSRKRHSQIKSPSPLSQNISIIRYSGDVPLQDTDTHGGRDTDTGYSAQLTTVR